MALKRLMKAPGCGGNIVFFPPDHLHSNSRERFSNWKRRKAKPWLCFVSGKMLTEKKCPQLEAISQCLSTCKGAPTCRFARSSLACGIKTKFCHCLFSLMLFLFFFFKPMSCHWNFIVTRDCQAPKNEGISCIVSAELMQCNRILCIWVDKLYVHKREQYVCVPVIIICT